MTALVGFLMIVLIVTLLLKGYLSPIVTLTIIPAVAALILGYTPSSGGILHQGRNAIHHQQRNTVHILGDILRDNVRRRNV
ncbi:MAG: hypothetical protein IJU26_02260 [Synergistaceae bacterium]|nr:hypothetical protein [Synergistaceae bacterium]